MKNKRGSHVSFIISFVLFVSFLIFFIGIIKPFEKAETGKEALLKHLENEIIKEVSDAFLVISAKEKIGGGNSCSNIESLIGTKKNIFLEDDMGLIKIYISDEFASFGFSCASQDKYEIGLIRTEKYILKSKFLELNDNYNDNYETLKSNFEISENDFEFSLLDINKNAIIESKHKETPPIEVLAELVPITYIDDINENDAEIKNGYIKVVLW